MISNSALTQKFRTHFPQPLQQCGVFLRLKKYKKSYRRLRFNFVFSANVLRIILSFSFNQTLQDPDSSGFRATSFFRKRTDFSNVPQHFGGSTLVVKHLIRDCSPMYTHKHISPLTVLSSNSKTSRGGHLMHLQKRKLTEEEEERE